MFPVTVFSFDVQFDETIQLPIVVTGDDQTLIQIDISLKKIINVENRWKIEEYGEDADLGPLLMELEIKVSVIGSVNGLPDTSSFRVNDYTSHPSDFTADFALHYVDFGDPVCDSDTAPNRNPTWSSATTPFRKKWPVKLDRSLMRTNMNGREVFSADLVIGSYKRNFSVSDDEYEDYEQSSRNMTKNEDYGSFSSEVPSDPESGDSLADHSANSDIFNTDDEGEGPSSPHSPRAGSGTGSDTDMEPPKTKRKRNAQQHGSDSESHYSTDPELGEEPEVPDDNEGPNQEDLDDSWIDDNEEDGDDSFINDKDETIESSRAEPDESDADSDEEQPKSKRSRIANQLNSDSDEEPLKSKRRRIANQLNSDSDEEPPKPKKRKAANQLKSDSSSESHYSTDDELGDSPTHLEVNDEGDGNDNKEETMESEEALRDSPTNIDNSLDEFSDGNPGDLCFSPEDHSDGPVMSPDNEDEEREDEEEYNFQNSEEAQFSP